MRDGASGGKSYWDGEVSTFDSIYSRKKSRLGVFLDSVFRKDVWGRFQYALGQSEPITGKSLLDVGCGTGRYSLEFARRGAGRVVGIDTSEMMIETCRRRAREEGLDDRCSFIQTDPAHYRPDSAFDVCTAMGLLDYVREPLPMMAKMREMVRDRAIMSFPRRLTWRAPVRKVRLMLKGCYVRFYTCKEIERLVEEAGFARHDCQVIGKLYCVTALVE